MFERFFQLESSGTTVGREVRAGFTTFLTMAYILFVNPQILAEAGLAAEDVAVATALAAAVGTAIMGLVARYPFALAPGMGLNAYFAFGVVGGLGVSWQVALAAVFVEGVLFMLLALGGIRRAILAAVPMTLKQSTTVGIGLFLAFVGLRSGGIVEADAASVVRLGDPSSPEFLLTLCGLVVVATLIARRVPGAILIGIVGVAGMAWGLGLSPAPEGLMSRPHLPQATLFALDFGDLASGALVTAVLAFLFVDVLDTAGTLIGVGILGGFVDAKGELARADRAFFADAAATTAGALLGTSTVTTYIESATGVEEGGRTGLTALVVAALFLLSLVFTPFFVAVPVVATAPVLIVVGAMMMRGAGGIDWKSTDEAVPAFLTIAAMPFTFSIANGLALGVTSWVGIKLLLGRGREVGPWLYVLAASLVLFYLFLKP